MRKVPPQLESGWGLPPWSLVPARLLSISNSTLSSSPLDPHSSIYSLLHHLCRFLSHSVLFFVFFSPRVPGQAFTTPGGSQRDATLRNLLSCGTCEQTRTDLSRGRVSTRESPQRTFIPGSLQYVSHPRLGCTFPGITQQCRFTVGVCRSAWACFLISLYGCCLSGNFCHRAWLRSCWVPGQTLWRLLGSLCLDCLLP